MADIKNYLKEREKRQEEQADYRSKIQKHRRSTLYRVLLVLLVLAFIVTLVVVQYNRHIYTGYDIVSSIERETASNSMDMRLADSILTYSKDGAHCTDTRGEVRWNQTYEMQNIEIAACQGTVAIGGYNDRSIYVQNTRQQLGTITTTMPIRDLAVSMDGRVAAVLADTDVTWINVYAADGQMLYEGQVHMDNSGYPAAVSLSPNGELLAVCYWYVDAGTIKTNVAFYNFGSVGTNYGDLLVSVYPYTDTLFPPGQFMNDSTAFAVGDGRLAIYSGGQKPTEVASHFYEGEVLSVFYDEDDIGLVFRSDTEEGKYCLNRYNTSGERVGSYYFDLEYTDLFFQEDTFVVYNETECMIQTFSGVEKYHGYFHKTVDLMLPGNAPYKFILVTEQSIDTIQLK